MHKIVWEVFFSFFKNEMFFHIIGKYSEYLSTTAEKDLLLDVKSMQRKSCHRKKCIGNIEYVFLKGTYNFVS